MGLWMWRPRRVVLRVAASRTMVRSRFLILWTRFVLRAAPGALRERWFAPCASACGHGGCCRCPSAWLPSTEFEKEPDGHFFKEECLFPYCAPSGASGERPLPVVIFCTFLWSSDSLDVWMLTLIQSVVLCCEEKKF